MNWKSYPKNIPPKNQLLLITILKGNEERFVTISEYEFVRHLKSFGFNQDWGTQKIIAWSIIPEPYSGPINEGSIKLRDLV